MAQRKVKKNTNVRRTKSPTKKDKPKAKVVAAKRPAKKMIAQAQANKATSDQFLKHFEEMHRKSVLRARPPKRMPMNQVTMDKGIFHHRTGQRH